MVKVIVILYLHLCCMSCDFYWKSCDFYFKPYLTITVLILILGIKGLPYMKCIWHILHMYSQSCSLTHWASIISVLAVMLLKPILN